MTETALSVESRLPRLRGRPPVRLLDENESLLLLIDLQPKLSRTMPEALAARMLKQSTLLAKSAGLLGVPVIATRQYPQGLGPLAAEISASLPAETLLVDKTCFSCASAPEVAERLQSSARRQIVLAGIEAHVCVLQTAVDLLDQGFEVHIAADAVCSRSPEHLANALSRLGRMGAVLSNSESVVFEWLRDALHPQFKAVSALLR